MLTALMLKPYHVNLAFSPHLLSPIVSELTPCLILIRSLHTKILMVNLMDVSRSVVC
jgi:hypothetical protein